MTHQNNTDNIEAGIERDRASLASTIGALQDRISVEHLAQEALGVVKTNAAGYTRAIDKAVRANPVALALTAVGVAWLIFGTRKPNEEPSAEAIERWTDEGGAPSPPDVDDTVHSKSVPGGDWLRDTDRLRARADQKIRAIEAEARDHARAVGDGISEGLGTVRDFGAERAEVLGELAEGMKRGFRKGLDDLSEASRETIVAARERAYAVRIRAETIARGGTREAGRVIEDHPLTAGIVAFAAGAAFAAALPRTRIEDRTFGAQSDRLMEEADQLLREERARLGRIAAGVADELKVSSRAAAEAVLDEVTQASRTAALAVSETAADTAKAVKNRACKEATSTPAT